MKAAKFRVTSVQMVKDLRGRDMRRLQLSALPSEPFGVDAEGRPDPSPAGAIELVFTPEAAKKFSIGDEFAVMFREKDAD